MNELERFAKGLMRRGNASGDRLSTGWIQPGVEAFAFDEDDAGRFKVEVVGEVDKFGWVRVRDSRDGALYRYPAKGLDPAGIVEIQRKPKSNGWLKDHEILRMLDQRARRGEPDYIKRLAIESKRLDCLEGWAAAWDYADNSGLPGLKQRVEAVWPGALDDPDFRNMPISVKGNPGEHQLQIIENGDVVSLAHRQFKLWHGKLPSRKRTWTTKGGNDKEFNLVFLGFCPAIDWVHSECDSCDDHHLVVEKSPLDWHGHRARFGESNMPILAADVDANEAVIVQGGLNLKKFLDGCGRLGEAPAVEYVVKGVKGGSSKGAFHWIHKFTEGWEPTLEWDEELNGFRYKGGSYRLEDFFHD